MGKKIPMWQCLIVIVAMLAFLIWEIVICKDEEGHLALICAAIVAAVVAIANGWKWSYLAIILPGRMYIHHLRLHGHFNGKDDRGGVRKS